MTGRPGVADSYNGKPLNSPKDVVVKSDGRWVSPPELGIRVIRRPQGGEREHSPPSIASTRQPASSTMMADRGRRPQRPRHSRPTEELYIVASRASRTAHRVVRRSADGTKIAAVRCDSDAGRAARPTASGESPELCAAGAGLARARWVAIFNRRAADRPYRSPERAANYVRRPLPHRFRRQAIRSTTYVKPGVQGLIAEMRVFDSVTLGGGGRRWP